MRPHLASLVEDFRRAGGQIAIVQYRGVRRYVTSYAEVAELAGRFSAELQRRGAKPGDRVVLWGENSAAWIGAFFGCLLRGVLAVPLDVTGSREFSARVIGNVQPVLVVADEPRLRLLTEEATHKLSLDRLREVLPREPLFTVDPAVVLDEPFQIVFTSGTTSEPKGIVHTHRNVLASLDPIEREIAKYRRYERPFHPLRFLHSLPLSHVFGQFMGLWIPGVLTAEVHFEQQLEPARLVERIRHERISVLVAVPRVLEVLRAHLVRNFPGLRAEIDAAQGIPLWKRFWGFRRVHRALGWKFWALICGGASLPADLELFWGRMGFALVQGYGMTETAALITLNHPFHIGRGTIGKPLPGREVRLGEDGEIQVRGDMVSTATWSNGHLVQREDEWLSTGDLATQDEGGDLRFVGRKGDAIVTAAGLNIFPVDLESALLAQPGVRGAVVVSCEGVHGPEPVAVLLCENTESARKGAVDGANAMLTEFQRMRRALHWPEPQFPFTSTGKLLRRKVADWACAELAGRADISGKPQDTLLSLIENITGERLRHATEDARLTAELGLDSLGLVQLQSALEHRYQIEVTDDAYARVQTLGDLRAFVEKAMPRAARTVPPAPFTAADAGKIDAGEITADIKVTTKPASAMETEETSMPKTTLEHRYPRWTWSTPVQWIRMMFQEAAMRPLVRLLAKPRVEATPHTRPQRPVLLIANHVTTYDVPLVLYGLPYSLRSRVAPAMSGEMLLDYRRGKGAGTPLLNWLMPVAYWLLTILFNIFPLPRLAGFRQSFAHAGEALDRGYSVLVFPEGHRTDDGRLQHFRPGIGLLAQQAEVPIIPVALVGLGDLKASGKGWFRSRRLTVRVGAIIPYDRMRTPEELTKLLEEKMRELLQEN